MIVDSLYSNNRESLSKPPVGYNQNRPQKQRFPDSSPPLFARWVFLSQKPLEVHLAPMFRLMAGFRPFHPFSSKLWILSFSNRIFSHFSENQISTHYLWFYAKGSIFRGWQTIFLPSHAISGPFPIENGSFYEVLS
jgi:hypothetical protein